MSDLTSNTALERKKRSLGLKLFTLTGLIIAILLIIDTVFYFQLQNRITHQVDSLKTQAGVQGQEIHFDISRRGGWPFGAWARIDTPKFSKKDDTASASFLGTAARIGGTWADWLKGYTQHHGVPITLVGKSVAVIAAEPYSTTILTEDVRFYASNSSNKGLKAPFNLNQARLEISKDGTLINTTMLHDIKGVMQSRNEGETQHNMQAMESFADHAETTIHAPEGPVSLKVGHMHLAYNALTTPKGTVFTLQDYSFQLPSLALSSQQKDHKKNDVRIPAVALSGKVTTETKSVDVTLRVDAWRDLIKSGYHQFGKNITGEKVSPLSEALLGKLLGKDHDKDDKPLVMTASLKNGQIENIDLGVLQPLLQMFTGFGGSDDPSP